MDQGSLFLPEDDPNVINAKLDFDPIDKLLWGNLPYAVNFNDHIIFTDGETNIIYKDQKIILANGKLFNEDMIQVRENMSIFEFVINDIQISTAICENWITKDLDEQELVLSQNCKSSSKTDNNTISKCKSPWIFSTINHIFVPP